MSNSKTIISLLLSVIMIMSVFNIVPLGVSAAEAEITKTGAESGTTGDCTWTLDNGVLTISGNGEMGDYYYNITLKNGSHVAMTTAPWGTYSFHTVVIGNGVTNIGGFAFSGCTEMTSVDIPDSVTSISYDAFYGCTGLKSVTLSQTAVNGFKRIFYNCSQIESIILNNAVTSIGEAAFSGYKELTSVSIPKYVSDIAASAFFGCVNLSRITIDTENRRFDSRDDSNAVIDSNNNTLIIGCKATVIPDSVNSIGSSAFNGCTGLTSIDIPDSVTSIGARVFYGCSGLTSVTISNSVTSIGDSAFYGCTGLTSIDIPDSVTSIGARVFYGCTGLTSIDIPDSVTSIGSEAFYGCTGLMSIVIPDSVTSIGDSAFRYCTSLTSIDIPDSVTSIGSYAFYNNAWYNNLPNGLVYAGKVAYKMKGTCPSEVVIKNGTVSITDYAFYDCTSLTSVTIPDSVTSIGDYSFYGCTELTSINIPDSVTTIEPYTFYNCSSLTSVTLGVSVTSIGSYAFFGCTGLTSVTIPVSVTTVGEHSFDNCGSLKDVYYGGSEKQWSNINIAGYYKSDNEALKKADIHYAVVDYSMPAASVENSNFWYQLYEDNAWITDYKGDEAYVTIPSALDGHPVTGIAAGAFSNNTRIKSVTIPDTVTTIGGYISLTYIHFEHINCNSEAEFLVQTKDIEEDQLYTIDYIGAFAHCSNLKKVNLGNGVQYIEEGAFYNCDNLERITIPKSVTEIESAAFYDCSALSYVDIQGAANISVEEDVESDNIIGYYLIGGYYENSNDAPGQNTEEEKRWVDVQVEIHHPLRGSFENCSNLNTVHLDDGVKMIGYQAFKGCTKLRHINIPDSITDICEHAFYDCLSLRRVSIPASVKYIGSKAFSYYTSFIVNYDGEEVLRSEARIDGIDGFVISGYKDSEAEKYAKNNSLRFEQLESKTDEATGIILDIPEDTDLVVKDITSEIVCDLPDGCNKMTAYDITLTKDGEAVQPENTVTVKIPCENENAKVYRKEADSTMTDMNAKYKEGYMVFTADHFSVYILAEPESEGVTVPGDVTGDGKTNVQDCTAILRYVRRIDALSDDQLKCGDVTGDGKVNVQDVTRILRHVRQIEALY